MYISKYQGGFMADISLATVQRLPIYLDHLKNIAGKSEYISATALAQALGFGEVQVRKDLASVSSSGKPKIGYNVEALAAQIEKYLGYNHTNNAIIIGAGKLGRALISYDGFSRYGLNIVAAFDISSDLIGTEEGGKPIYGMPMLNAFCEKERVHIGIITVPAAYAQDAADALVDAGIQAIWNFAPTHLDLPERIILKNENMASSLAVLSSMLARSNDQK
jgi:redox-sensing transcriptional repressor